MSDELKPCPFCGERAEILLNDMSDYGSQHFWQISCRSDDCGFGMTSENRSNESKEAVVSKWSTRPIEDALRTENDALRHTLMELRARYHASGRRPEECYEMSMIDAALADLKEEK